MHAGGHGSVCFIPPRNNWGIHTSTAQVWTGSGSDETCSAKCQRATAHRQTSRGKGKKKRKRASHSRTRLGLTTPSTNMHVGKMRPSARSIVSDPQLHKRRATARPDPDGTKTKRPAQTQQQVSDQQHRARDRSSFTQVTRPPRTDKRMPHGPCTGQAVAGSAKAIQSHPRGPAGAATATAKAGARRPSRTTTTNEASVVLRRPGAVHAPHPARAAKPLDAWIIFDRPRLAGRRVRGPRALRRMRSGVWTYRVK